MMDVEDELEHAESTHNLVTMIVPNQSRVLS